MIVQDMSRFKEIGAMLEGILAHRRAHPTTKVDEYYYELLARYYGGAMTAREQGKLLIAHTTRVPFEVFRAMDMVTLNLEGCAMVAVPVGRSYEEIAALARGFGLAPEICANHKAQLAMFLKGWIPRPDALIWQREVCDSSNKDAELLRTFFDTPAFYLDRPYRVTDKEMAYYAQEIGDMIGFLEKLCGRRLDWERLREVMGFTQRMVELHGQIEKLCQTVPSPAGNRLAIQMQMVSRFYEGTPEGVRFYEMVVADLKDRIARGAQRPERFRLMSLFFPPAHSLKLWDWLQEQGVSVVADPLMCHWGDWKVDPSRPLESLARKVFAMPISRQMGGPTDEAMVPDVVKLAVEQKVDGAVYWAFIGCPQGCAAIRHIKDALVEKGIPTLTLDVDVLDASFSSVDDLRDKLEGFLEVLAERVGR